MILVTVGDRKTNSGEGYTSNEPVGDDKPDTKLLFFFCIEKNFYIFFNRKG